MLNELKLNIDDSRGFNVVVEENSRGFWLLLFGGLKDWIEIHHSKANQGVRSFVRIPQFQLEMSAIFLEATINKEIKCLIKNRLFATFEYSLTGRWLIRDPDLEVGIHGKEGGCFVFDFGVDNGDSKDTIKRRKSYCLWLLYFAWGATHLM